MTTRILAAAFVVALLLCSGAAAQTTAFTYQGSLQSSGTPANGNFDFEFLLFTAELGGSQIGSVLARNNVAVANGTFSVSLDFGSQFPGADRFLEIRVRQSGGGAHTALAPRQKIESSPHSIKSLNSETAVNATQLGGVAASEYVTTTTGGTNFVRNTTTPQASSNFNIRGNGTAGGTLSGNIINTTTQYNIGGSRILSNAGTNNLFAGVGAGQNNTTGIGGAFFGSGAGAANTTGILNSFFGSNSGVANTIGSSNSFFGSNSGAANTSGFYNAFFGQESGRSNTTAFENSFFGVQAGKANTTGSDNSFFGAGAGNNNTTGGNNAFFGAGSGTANTTASDNAFFGTFAGFFNTTVALYS